MIKIEVLSDKTISEGNIHDLESDNVAWADIVNPTKDELKIIGKLVGLESSAIESLLEENSRPMINNLEKYSVIVFSTPLKEESVKPLVIFISKSTNDFITVRYGESRSINRINSWLTRFTWNWRWGNDTNKSTLSTPKKTEVGRNDPCWCGSGKKYKKCHYPN